MLFKTSAVFAENLAQFPSTDAVERIDIYQDENLVSTVTDKPSGSLALYYYLFKTMGVLDYSAASRGLELYGQYATLSDEDVERLVLITSTNQTMQMKVTYKAGVKPAEDRFN